MEERKRRPRGSHCGVRYLTFDSLRQWRGVIGRSFYASTTLPSFQTSGLSLPADNRNLKTLSLVSRVLLIRLDSGHRQNTMETNYTQNGPDGKMEAEQFEGVPVEIEGDGENEAAAYAIEHPVAFAPENNPLNGIKVQMDVLTSVKKSFAEKKAPEEIAYLCGKEFGEWLKDYKENHQWEYPPMDIMEDWWLSEVEDVILAERHK